MSKTSLNGRHKTGSAPAPRPNMTTAKAELRHLGVELGPSLALEVLVASMIDEHYHETLVARARFLVSDLIAQHASNLAELADFNNPLSHY